MVARGQARVERRFAAILAADVAGYSRLIGADEEGTLERLRALRAELTDPKIAEHRGRTVKTTGGLAFAHIAARRFEEAIEWADRALHDQPRFTVAVRAKVVANAHLGRLDEARAELGRMLALYPGLTIAAWRAFAATPFAPELVELYLTGLRLAGLPEE